VVLAVQEVLAVTAKSKKGCNINRQQYEVVQFTILATSWTTETLFLIDAIIKKSTCGKISGSTASVGSNSNSK